MASGKEELRRENHFPFPNLPFPIRLFFHADNANPQKGYTSGLNLVEYQFDRQGEVVQMIDQNGTQLLRFGRPGVFVQGTLTTDEMGDGTPGSGMVDAGSTS